MSAPWLGHPEFVPEWDVYRDENGEPVTLVCSYGHYDGPPLNALQLAAVNHAAYVWELVCEAEGSHQASGARDNDGVIMWKSPNVAKSRLLERMIHFGLPPTRTKPPIQTAGPAWWLLPGGDPFGPYPKDVS